MYGSARGVDDGDEHGPGDEGIGGGAGWGFGVLFADASGGDAEGRGGDDAGRDRVDVLDRWGELVAVRAAAFGPRRVDGGLPCGAEDRCGRLQRLPFLSAAGGVGARRFACGGTARRLGSVGVVRPYRYGPADGLRAEVPYGLQGHPPSKGLRVWTLDLWARDLT